MNDTNSQLLQLICSHRKLERDKGIQEMEKSLAYAEDKDVVQMSDAILFTLQDASQVWESKHGALIGITRLIPILVTRTISSDMFFHSCQTEALHLLTDSEVRVRLGAGEVLGVLCKYWGPQVYMDCKETVMELIKNNLERQSSDFMDSNQDLDILMTKFSSSPTSERRMSAEEIFHDTAGWKTLETSMKALQFMVDGCGSKFPPFITQELFDVICNAFVHTNRFVRETAFCVCSALVTCSKDAYGNENDILFQFGHQFCKFLGLGMSDNWSQVRLASSVATRQFLLSLANESDREIFYPELLPKMCLNRYYLADGVRLYSQETWRLITNSCGKQLVEKYLTDVIKFYVSQTQADNHAVREASCSCIAELAKKITHEAMKPYIAELMSSLLVCFQDDSWPVRDAACLASGNFISCFPNECKESLSTLFPLFFMNLEDNITSVRQGGSAALANVVKAYDDEEIFNVVLNKLESGLKAVNDQPSESEKYGGLDKGPAIFGVVKKLRDNDTDLHTNQTMYSCGSLAPKMGRGHLGCGLDRTFRRPTQPWEQTDGCVYLLSELANNVKTVNKIENFIPVLAEVATKRHFTHHYVLLETIFKQLPVIAKGIGKKNFKKFLELFFDSLFYALSSDNALTSTAASECLIQLSELFGVGIMRGRIELYNNSLLPKFEECIQNQTSSMFNVQSFNLLHL